MTKLVAVGSHIAVKDLSLPKGVTVVESADDIVVSAVAVAEEAEPIASIDMSAIGSSSTKGSKKEESAE